jgi:hypothetical protein
MFSYCANGYNHSYFSLPLQPGHCFDTSKTLYGHNETSNNVCTGHGAWKAAH